MILCGRVTSHEGHECCTDTKKVWIRTKASYSEGNSTVISWKRISKSLALINTWWKNSNSWCLLLGWLVADTSLGLIQQLKTKAIQLNFCSWKSDEYLCETFSWFFTFPRRLQELQKPWRHSADSLSADTSERSTRSIVLTSWRCRLVSSTSCNTSRFRFPSCSWESRGNVRRMCPSLRLSNRLLATFVFIMTPVCLCTESLKH